MCVVFGLCCVVRVLRCLLSCLCVRCVFVVWLRCVVVVLRCVVVGFCCVYCVRFVACCICCVFVLYCFFFFSDVFQIG